jgi:hypothetical protein
VIGATTGLNLIDKKKRNNNLQKNKEVPVQASDYYVSPNGETFPSTGYRYSDSRYADSISKSRESPGTPGGHYVGFEKFDSAAQAQDRYQISKDWSDTKVRGEFDTLQLYDQKTGRWKASVPTAKGNVTDIPEPYTSSYPEYGKGGSLQYITEPGTTLKYNGVEVIGE